MFGASLSHFGLILSHHGALLSQFGSSSEPTWAILEPSWAILGHLGAILQHLSHHDASWGASWSKKCRIAAPAHKNEGRPESPRRRQVAEGDPRDSECPTRTPEKYKGQIKTARWPDQAKPPRLRIKICPKHRSKLQKVAES